MFIFCTLYRKLKRFRYIKNKCNTRKYLLNETTFLKPILLVYVLIKIEHKKVGCHCASFTTTFGNIGYFRVNFVYTCVQFERRTIKIYEHVPLCQSVMPLNFFENYIEPP